MIALTGKKYVEKLVQMSDGLIFHFSFRMNNEIMAIPELQEKEVFTQKIVRRRLLKGKNHLLSKSEKDRLAMKYLLNQ
jgi:hypothetical protein